MINHVCQVLSGFTRANISEREWSTISHKKRKKTERKKDVKKARKTERQREIFHKHTE